MVLNRFYTKEMMTRSSDGRDATLREVGRKKGRKEGRN